MREKLASILEEEEEWSEAAKTLMSITFESGHRTIPDAYKVRTYIHIVQLLLEDEDATIAESYLNRASLILPNVEDKQLQLQFKASQARISDFKRQVGLDSAFLVIWFSSHRHPFLSTVPPSSLQIPRALLQRRHCRL